MRTNIATIQRVTADEFGISLKSLSSRSHFALYAIPRQAAMWLARELNGDSFPMIAHWFDRDHTTVIQGCRRTRKRIADDEEFAQRVRRLADDLRPTIDHRCAVLGHIPDASSRKSIVMRWWEAGEITPEQAEDMIRDHGLEAA